MHFVHYSASSGNEIEVNFLVEGFHAHSSPHFRLEIVNEQFDSAWLLYFGDEITAHEAKVQVSPVDIVQNQ